MGQCWVMVVDGSEQCLVPSCKTVFSWVNVGLCWLMAVNSAWFDLVRQSSHGSMLGYGG